MLKIQKLKIYKIIKQACFHIQKNIKYDLNHKVDLISSLRFVWVLYNHRKTIWFDVLYVSKHSEVSNWTL